MITFITKPIFFLPGAKGGQFPRRLTARVRGEEMAQHLGGKFSIDGKYDESDTCIYLKPRSLDRVRDQDYVDILDDGHLLIPQLKLRPKIGVIVYNLHYLDYLKKELPNEIIYIPHHHINFDNEIRTKNKPLVGGMIGPAIPEVYDIYEKIKASLGDIEFKSAFLNNTREEMLNFYKEIDFQVIWYENKPEGVRGL